MVTHAEAKIKFLKELGGRRTRAGISTFDRLFFKRRPLKICTFILFFYLVPRNLFHMMFGLHPEIVVKRKTQRVA